MTDIQTAYRLPLVCLFTAWVLLCSHDSLKAQSLEDYLLIAANEHPGLKAAYARFEIHMQRVNQVALPDPKLSFGYFVRPVETRVGAQSAKVSLTQTFPWWGTLGAQTQVAERQAEAAYQTFLEAKNAMFHQVKAAYFSLYEVHETLRWQKAHLAILNTFKTLATTYFSNKKGTLADVIRADIMLNDSKTEITLLEQSIRPLRIAFNRLLNRADTLPVAVETLPMVAFQPSDSLPEHHPKLAAMDQAIAAAKAHETLAKKQGLPAIGVGLDYIIVAPRQDVAVLPDNGKDVVMPMVSLSLPIFRKKYKALAKEAQLKHARLLAEKEQVRNQLASDYEKAKYELLRAKKSYELYDIQIAQTQEALNLLYTAYSHSGKDFDEVLRLQQQRLQYEIAKTHAAKDFHIAMSQCDYLTAKMIR